MGVVIISYKSEQTAAEWHLPPKVGGMRRHRSRGWGILRFPRGVTRQLEKGPLRLTRMAHATGKGRRIYMFSRGSPVYLERLRRAPPPLVISGVYVQTLILWYRTGFGRFEDVAERDMANRWDPILYRVPSESHTPRTDFLRWGRRAWYGEDEQTPAEWWVFFRNLG